MSRISEYPKRLGGLQGDEEIVMVFGSAGTFGQPDYVAGITYKATL